ncbi:MAG: transglutaminase, partial [Proteobacteria bacterium]|nr:transglutaminase [Pseudomonadota bacterium]
MNDSPDAYLQPGRFVDSDDPGVIALAEKSVIGINGELERALALYY